MTVVPEGEGNGKGVGSIVGARDPIQVEFLSDGLLDGLFVGFAIAGEAELDLGGSVFLGSKVGLGKGEEDNTPGLGHLNGVAHFVEEEFFDGDVMGLKGGQQLGEVLVEGLETFGGGILG